MPNQSFAQGEPEKSKRHSRVTFVSVVGGALVAVILGAIAIISSCDCKECKTSGEKPQHVVESSGLVGIWQQMMTNEVVDEETGLVLTAQVARPRYKVIMADGTYYIMDAVTDADGVVHSNIVHYGTYDIVGDTLQVEHIECCSFEPRLNGHDSYVRYTLPDVNTFSLYFKFGIEEEIPGSTEWTPEIWKRVQLFEQ